MNITLSIVNLLLITAFQVCQHWSFYMLKMLWCAQKPRYSYIKGKPFTIILRLCHCYGIDVWILELLFHLVPNIKFDFCIEYLLLFVFNKFKGW